MIVRMVQGARLNPLDLNWQRFLVAEDGTGIVGVGQIRPHRKVPELASLVVREDRRGQGIGGQLVRALIAQSPGTLYLFCGHDMERFYAQLGFHAVGVKESPPALRWKYILMRLITRLIEGHPILLMKQTSGASGTSEG